MLQALSDTLVGRHLVGHSVTQWTELCIQRLGQLCMLDPLAPRRLNWCWSEQPCLFPPAHWQVLSLEVLFPFHSFRRATKTQLCRSGLGMRSTSLRIAMSRHSSADASIQGNR